MYTSEKLIFFLHQLLPSSDLRLNFCVKLMSLTYKFNRSSKLAKRGQRIIFRFSGMYTFHMIVRIHFARKASFQKLYMLGMSCWLLRVFRYRCQLHPTLGNTFGIHSTIGVGKLLTTGRSPSAVGAVVHEPNCQAAQWSLDGLGEAPM